MLLTTLLLTIANPAAAHELYLKLDTYRLAPGDLVRLEYHNGDSFPRSEVAVKIDRIRDAKIRLGALEVPIANLKTSANHTTTSGEAKLLTGSGTAVVFSRTLPNLIELPPPKFEEYLREEGLERIIAERKQKGESAKPGRERYSKYVKALAQVGPTVDKAAPGSSGLAIEFVPLVNPYSLKPGASLPVRVLHQGKPVAGLPVEAANLWQGKVSKKHVGNTDAKGEIQVKLDNAGLWKLHT